MKIFKIMYDEVVVGIVVNKDGDATPESALNAWNNANPSYAGDGAQETEFVEI